MAGPLEFDRDAIAVACRRMASSVSSYSDLPSPNGFDEVTSDADFLVEFQDDLESGFDAYFGLKESLEDLLGHPVDLVAWIALENPHFAVSVSAA